MQQNFKEKSGRALYGMGEHEKTLPTFPQENSPTMTPEQKKNAKLVLTQIINDVYRTETEKEQARQQLAALNGVSSAVAAPGTVVNNSGSDARIAGLEARVAMLEQKVAAYESAALEPIQDLTPPIAAPVNPTPTEPPQPETRVGPGRPKGTRNRYAVEGERGSWGIQDRDTGLFVGGVHKYRKDADKLARLYNQDPSAVPVQDETAQVTHSAPPNSTVQDPEPELFSGSPTPRPPAEPPKMYDTTEEKPAPPRDERPDREQAAEQGNAGGIGRVPWYAT